ncbi:MAG: GMC family oxidoreductase [Burkholderiales bacterium]|nr:GMC family oxidoreductase [Burkholderiales bacterium]
MSRTRRDFLVASGKAALATGIGAPVLAGCWGEEVYEPAGVYDAIIVGGGTAGVIVAARMQAASGGRKRILVIEAGGPTSATVGGTAYPPWAPAGRRDLTMFDVPGEYSQIPWTPFGSNYQLTETGFTYQGIGLGGNSQFNGMLMQTNPPAAFDQRWPAGWRSADLAPHFDRVRDRIPVTSTPSTDGVPQNTGPADIVHPLYASRGWVETDTSRPFDAAGAYSRPYVAASGGRRRGPLSGYYLAIAPGGTPPPGLELLYYAKAARIEFDAAGHAVAVHYVKRDGLDQQQAGVAGRARVRAGGLVVLAAGALVTPRLLLLSGVGPRGREAEIFPGQARASFAIDNPGVGVGLYDHVITMVTYAYDGPVPYAAYNYGDYAGNTGDLARYLADGSGPYAQYQPVSLLQLRYGSAVPAVEVFLNPNGAGTPGGPYWGPRTFSAYVMLLDPKARGVVALDAGDNVIPPALYLPATADGEADTLLMTQGLFDMMQLFAQNPALKLVFGPGSASHPNLRPDVPADVRTYVTGPSPVDGVHFNRLVANHWGGTAALQAGPGGVDPATLVVRGTGNVAVVDASLIPTSVPGHPVATIMAVADRAGDLLASRWA